MAGLVEQLHDIRHYVGQRQDEALLRLPSKFCLIPAGRTGVVLPSTPD